LSKVVGSMKDIIVRLEQRGERAVKGISDMFQDNGEKIRDLAIEFAPILTGATEDSIRKNTSNTGINRRAVVEIYLDETTEAGPYLRKVHDNLAPHGSGRWGKVGGSDPNSLSAQKDAGRGIVGGKFLTRAFKLYKDKIQRDANRIVKRAFEK
jgi:hypothetical protein